jgi:hypothetical protein
MPGARLLAPPALRERRHRGLARGLIARASASGLRDRRRSASISTASLQRRGRPHDAADDDAIGEHVIVALAPFAG